MLPPTGLREIRSLVPAMLGPRKVRRLDQPMLVSLETLVPRDNFYRRLEAALDLDFVRDWVAETYADRGRPSIDPVVFFKLQLILFFEGLRSERKLIETASLHLAHRWYLGYALDEPLPDHSSLTRIRTRLGVAVFQRFFEYIVDLCRDVGLVWGKELFFDGTKIRANADIDSLSPRFYQQAKQQAREHVAALFAADTPDGATHTDQPPPDVPGAPSATSNPVPAAAAMGTTVPDDGYGPVSLPFAGPPEAAQQLAAETEAQWQLLAERRLDPDRPPSGP